VPDLRERWRTGRLEATVYDSVVEREQLARVFGRLIWGTETTDFYSEIARLADEPDGSAILDVPCGGGVAFRGLSPRQQLRYVAADLSPVMLERAHAEAQRRGLSQIELTQADVEALPFEDSTFDLCVTFTGLHCFPDPPAALAEIARVLRPGGAVRGTSVVKHAGPRQDAFVRVLQLAGVFGPGGSVEELESWLDAAGLLEITSRTDGALAYFSARRPDAGWTP
jgi:ubiquinone/menaquinone biosynthesis C-methylase UbiE